MKKMLSISVAFFVLLLFSFLVIRYNSGPKTIKEALSISHPEKINIIHEESTEHGIVVFYQKFSDAGFSAAVLKESFGNYKVIYSAAQGDISEPLNRFGFTYMFFPSIKNTSPPMYYGLIQNPDIAQIKIIEQKRGMDGRAKIIEGRDSRLWLMDMSPFEGSEFQIIALSKDNKEISKRNDNLSLQVTDVNQSGTEK
ncbi:hypothetical protein [Paenibacillus sp. S-12]|uniref:hypothetical protein n=1 Tax=Paenibacillus sp. S-12 TaxID=3031371 RepID=UPI0025A17B94|nr:hypothetical protein [Paenibacillus sp. S-12]